MLKNSETGNGEESCRKEELGCIWLLDPSEPQRVIAPKDAQFEGSELSPLIFGRMNHDVDVFHFAGVHHRALGQNDAIARIHQTPIIYSKPQLNLTLPQINNNHSSINFMDLSYF